MSLAVRTSGKLPIIITDTESGSQTYNGRIHLWSKAANYDSKVITVGIGASRTKAALPDKAVSLEDLFRRHVVKSSNGTVDSNGYLILPALSHSILK